MSLPHTILGFLSLGSMTGYELKRFMDNSTQFFWHAELSQIYPSLKQLEAKGLVKAEVIPQDGRPDKKIYSITETGRGALSAWLSEPLDETPPTKSPVLLKIFFMESLGKEDILAQMRCQLEAQRARLKRYQQETRRNIQEFAQTSGLATRGVLWELVRQYGELQTQTSILWLENAIEAVEEKL
jgi:PadR family transcriptional regulator, regulatory protein AphA